MGLADDLKEPAYNPWSKGCGITRLCAELEEVDRTALLEALDNSSLSHAFLEETLIKNGHIIGRDTIRRHRKGECCKDFK